MDGELNYVASYEGFMFVPHHGRVADAKDRNMLGNLFEMTHTHLGA